MTNPETILKTVSENSDTFNFLISKFPGIKKDSATENRKYSKFIQNNNSKGECIFVNYLVTI